MMKRNRLYIYLCLSFLPLISLKAQNNQASGLNAREFNKYWKVESESPDFKVTFRGDTAEIVSPKGLTLWRKEKMSGKVTIEYDACVVNETKEDRLSDLNCFWMASDPKYPDNLWKREKWRNGIFLNCYSLQLYYLGYGGNHNSTTRFRRYDGNETGITDPKARPAILKEYTDAEHLLKANHWYHIKITNENNRVSYYIDGKRLVDFRDAEPLTEGWFGFRSTLSRTRITNFRYECSSQETTAVPLQWIGNPPELDKPVSFGVPFDKGEVFPESLLQLRSANGEDIPVDTWPLAYWPDGSVKWSGVAGVIPAGTEKLMLEKMGKKPKKKSKAGNPNDGTSVSVTETHERIQIETGVISAYIPRQGEFLIDSLLYKGVKVGEKARLICNTQSEPVLETTSQVSFTNYTSELKSATVERSGAVRTLVKLEGVHKSKDGREWLPFVVRLYFYSGSEQVKMVHSFVFDGDQDKDFIRALGIRFDIPMREALYNRHIAFSCADGGVWSEPVQPLVGRRVLTLGKPQEKDLSLQQQQMEGKRIPPYEAFDEKNRSLLDNWASWDSYRLSQLTVDAFSIRKRANDNNPWIGTFSGTRSNGYAFAGDITGGLGLCLHDFWQSYPSSIEISEAKTPTATLTAWLWSPDSEPMNLRHYDNVAHDLNASYEDVQEGMSTPYGIARTTTLTLIPQGGYTGKEKFSDCAKQFSEPGILMPTPGYLHAQQAFGVWSLPDRSTPFRARVEDRLDAYIDFYNKAIEQNKWYGFWNYGDVMHAYDPVRHTWRYDIGGFAWDNTELASNMWLWYNFLRTGRTDIWRMAEAMTRHTAEVDTYHIGPNAGLGSRHNVSHWGCGAKEARISQAAWNRFYYYLTTDERCGDLMTEVKDAEQKLYTLDPMRLAQPRNEYPCTAPARLRIGPDWLAYAGNWMTEWERTGNTAYRDKITAGMKSIAALPNRIFTGPKALGFDPATGIITSECDPKLESTNHLMTIMGGFEIMNEMLRMIDLPEWNDAWLDLATRYKQKAWELNHSRFRISRLMGYAAYHTRNQEMAKEAWTDLFTRLEHTPAPPFNITTLLPPVVPAPLDECKSISTNDAALWSLDAIYMQEVIPMDE
uniref:exo-rhamnogalacturonan lyase family protein n=2 Tax=uncultured Bacteroides sp. TaxID=162156 RepID=UPI0035A57EC0